MFGALLPEMREAEDSMEALGEARTISEKQKCRREVERSIFLPFPFYSGLNLFLGKEYLHQFTCP